MNKVILSNQGKLTIPRKLVEKTKTILEITEDGNLLTNHFTETIRNPARPNLLMTIGAGGIVLHGELVEDGISISQRTHDLKFTNGYINLGRPAHLDLKRTENWKIEVTFKCFGEGAIISKGAEGDSSRQFYIFYEEGRIWGIFGSVGGQMFGDTPLNTWITVTAECISGIVTLSSSDGHSRTHTMGTVVAPNTDFLIGARRSSLPNTGFAFPFNGLIKDLKVWKQGAFVGDWKIDEGQGTTIIDHSPSKNNGIITGVTEWVKT